MTEEILDYSTIGHNEAYHYDPATVRSLNSQAFFSKVGYCKFCELQAPSVFLQGAYDLRDTAEQDIHVASEVFACNCGWWDMVTREMPNGRREYAEESWYFRKAAILRRFVADDLDLPIATLQIELGKNQSILDDVHISKYEEFIGSVLAEHILKCDVRHCGRSHDGGIDLYTVNCEEPFAIQVKRRTNLAVAESVSVVRELVGAMMAKGYMRGIFVTTRRFSRESKDYVAEVLARGAVSEFLLIDGSSLLSLFHLVIKAEQNPHWKIHLPLALRDLDSLLEGERRRRQGAWSRY